MHIVVFRCSAVAAEEDEGMRKYIGSGAAKQNRAESTEFQMHYLGNPSFERSVPKPVVADIPTEVEYGEGKWMMPNGGAAYRAVQAIIAGADVEAKIVALGGVRK
jgi:hypothetical protein